MRTIAGALACLACAAHENRGQRTNSLSQDGTYKKQRTPQQLATLLLSLNPTAGWHLASAVPSYVSVRRNPRRSHAHDVSMQRKGMSKEEKKQFKAERLKKRKAEQRRFFLETRRAEAGHQEQEEGWVTDEFDGLDAFDNFDDDFDDDFTLPTEPTGEPDSETVSETSSGKGWFESSYLADLERQAYAKDKLDIEEEMALKSKYMAELERQAYAQDEWEEDEGEPASEAAAVSPPKADVVEVESEPDVDLDDEEPDSWMEKFMQDYGEDLLGGMTESKDMVEQEPVSETAPMDKFTQDYGEDLLGGMTESKDMVEEEPVSETAPMGKFTQDYGEDLLGGMTESKGVVDEDSNALVEEEPDSETAPMLSSMEDLVKEHGDVSDFDDELLDVQGPESEAMELPQVEPYVPFGDGDGILKDPFRRMNSTLDPENPPLPGGIGTRTLGIDFGIRRIGIALSSGYAPLPLAVEKVKVPDIFAFQRVSQDIRRMAKKEWVEQVVVGMPYNSRGEEGKQAAVTRVFASILADTMAPCPVFFWDESFTSQEATLTMNDGKGPKANQAIDAHAAAHILASFFNADKKKRNAAPFSAPENKVEISRQMTPSERFAREKAESLEVRKKEYYDNMEENHAKERERKEKRERKLLRKKLKRRRTR